MARWYTNIITSLQIVIKRPSAKTQLMAVITLETDYPFETGYLLDNSCQTD